MLNKRELLRAFVAVSGSCSCGHAFAQESPRGCFLSASAAATFADATTLRSECGNQLIDMMMPAEISILNVAFQVRPDFSFYDDDSSANAFATPANLAGESPDGTVCFGVGLLAAEMNRSWWGAAVAGIAAHEWAHIAQFGNGMAGPVWKKELHADYLAGWYLGRKAMAGTPVVISGLGNSLFSKGSFDFNNPNWHGTPAQRVSAMVTGYNEAPANNTGAMAFARGAVVLGL